MKGFSFFKTAEQGRETIRKASKAACIVTTFFIVGLIVFFIMVLLRDIWAVLELPIRTVEILRFDVHLLQIGESNVFIPTITDRWTAGEHMGIVGTIIINVLASAFFTTIAFFVRSIFVHLKKDANPFNPKVSLSIASAAGAMLLHALIVGNFLWLVPGALMFITALLLDYGRILQEEADTTL